MEAVSYECDGSKYVVEPTKEVDIHYTKVKSLTSGTLEAAYKEAMLDSVYQNLSYKVTRDGEYVGHFYGRIIEDRYHGCSIFSTGDIVGTVLLLKHVFEQNNRKNVLFTPHGKKGLLRFISMAVGSSIRSWYAGNEYVVVTKHSIVHKGERMFHYLGIKECQQ
jgi:hypothetical protein